MKAVRYSTFGGPEVLTLAQVETPVPQQGEVVIRVHAAGVNQADTKARQGLFGVDLPAGSGLEAAGTVEAVGAGVEAVPRGTAVFGCGRDTHAEYAVLTDFLVKPDGWDWQQAGAVGIAADAAVRGLDLLEVGEGTTVLIDGASGGVGGLATQLAVARGARVIGTASAGNHDHLRTLGAEPISYGDGLAERVREVAPDGLDAVFDVAGRSGMATLVPLVDRPRDVVTIADSAAEEFGARATWGGGDRVAALQEVLSLVERAALVLPIQQSFDLTEAAEAHRISEQGHVRGKLVITPAGGSVG